MKAGKGQCPDTQPFVGMIDTLEAAETCFDKTPMPTAIRLNAATPADRRIAAVV